MIHRIFQWWARKKLARTRYRLDRRRYQGRFGAGFMSHLQHAHFWESDRDPGLRRQRLRRRLLWLFAAALVAFLLWATWESLRALPLF
jgi:hypothetical protein